MTIETSVLISVVSVGFAVYMGLTNIKRNKTSDDKTDASQLTTVIVKLENIGNGITEIKNEMGNVKNDLKDSRDRIIVVEESTKAAHKRLDVCERYCKRFPSHDEQS